MPIPHPHEDPERTTPIGFSRYAKEFLETALAADDVVGHAPGYEIIAPIPVMYLTGHAIELSLKAYLLHKGVTLRELRTKYGHDLHVCFKKAKEFGLHHDIAFTDTELGAFEILSDLYSNKELEYIITGAKTFPVFGPLETFAKKLINHIGPKVGYPRTLP